MGLDLDRRTLIGTIGTVGATSVVAGCTFGGQRGGNDTENSSQEIDGDDDERSAADVDVDDIAADPLDVPDPVDWDDPRRHELEIQSEELVAEIEDGTTYDFMTFGGQIPGPFIRARRGDTIHLTFRNPEDRNSMVHNLDFHAVYGPGGSAADTTIQPGEGPVEVEFTLEYPGAFYYHCAPGDHDIHISSGMFGTILVEPEDGLPEVDREIYLGQHELYTDRPKGEDGHHRFDTDAMQSEDPTYVLFNGEIGAFTEDGDYGRLPAETGETLRVYWCNAGPNLMSGPHPIGNVWSRWYDYGDLDSEPAGHVEGAALPAGTTGVGEMETPVPQPIHLVDHALSRVVRKGLMAEIEVEGAEDPDVYDSDP